MMTQAIRNSDNTISIKVEMDFEEAADFVRDQLLEYRKDIESLNDPSQISTWDAINEVLAYISSPSDLKDMELIEVKKKWVDTLVNG